VIGTAANLFQRCQLAVHFAEHSDYFLCAGKKAQREQHSPTKLEPFPRDALALGEVDTADGPGAPWLTGAVLGFAFSVCLVLVGLPTKARNAWPDAR
jgi:hypothetical protein